MMFNHPFSLIIASPSNGGKSTLAANIIKNGDKLVKGGGFDSVWIIYRSYQPLYDTMKEELNIPVYLFEKTLPDQLQHLLQQSSHQRPVVLIDDGLCAENEELVRDLFCRLGHHLSVSVILICQTLFDSRNPTLRICHRNAKALIVLPCPRDQGSLRTLIHQMEPDRNKAKALLAAVEKELETPYHYVMFDFQPTCPLRERVKTNILCENEPYPIVLVHRNQSYFGRH